MRTFALPIRRLLDRVAPSDAVMRQFARIALIGCAFDLATKELAVRVLNDQMIGLGSRFSLMLVWNLGAAGGVQIGPMTAGINAIVTVLAIGLVATVVRPIAALDPRAPLPLGLVSAGALGNLLSIVAGPEGVADFLGVRLTADTTVVVNVADLMLWTGSLLLVPVALRLLQAHRAERVARTLAPASATH